MVEPDEVGRRPEKNFWIITFVGVSGLHDPIIERFFEQGNVDPTDLTPAPVDPEVDPDDRRRMSRRRFWLDVSLLPQRVKNALRTTKRVRIRVQDRDGFIAASPERTLERTDDAERSL
jgi:hypothetical protein